jgi:hypothetical protein
LKPVGRDPRARRFINDIRIRRVIENHPPYFVSEISHRFPAGSVMLTEPVIFFVTNQTTGSIYNIEPA